jgi:hypothetical protein
MMTAAATGPHIKELDILAVWTALGGGPLRAGRGRAFWRNGDGYNIAIDQKRGVWHDKVTHEGGGILRLVETALGCDRRAALAWLADNFGIKTTTLSRDEKRQWSQRRALAEAAAKALAERTEAYLADLHLACGMLLRRYHRLMDEAYRHQDIDLVAQAEDVFAKLDELTARRDFLRAASAADVAGFFANIGKGVAA